MDAERVSEATKKVHEGMAELLELIPDMNGRDFKNLIEGDLVDYVSHGTHDYVDPTDPESGWEPKDTECAIYWGAFSDARRAFLESGRLRAAYKNHDSYRDLE